MCAITNFTQTWAKLGNTTNYPELFAYCFHGKFAKNKLRKLRKEKLKILKLPEQ